MDSFAATILYGLLALFGLVLAATLLHAPVAVVLGLLACGAAYVSQALFTLELDSPASYLQRLCVALWVAGVGALLWT